MADTMSEAPVSWNTRYTSPEGYDCQLTLRGDDLGRVMATAKRAIDAMSKAGCKPGNGNGHATPAATNGNGAAVPICPTHGKPMQQSKHGGWYCPVKIAEDDGSGRPVYCKAKATQ